MALVPGGETGYSNESKMRCCLYWCGIGIGIGIGIGEVYLYEPPLLTVTLTPFCSLGSLVRPGKATEPGGAEEGEGRKEEPFGEWCTTCYNHHHEDDNEDSSLTRI